MSSDFVQSIENSNLEQRRRLKKEAYPTVFANAVVPAYFTTTKPMERSQAATRDARFEKEEQRLEDQNVDFLHKDEECD